MTKEKQEKERPYCKLTQVDELRRRRSTGEHFLRNSAKISVT